jgi:hypothetical protein
MGINDEYSRDAYSYELAYDSDESGEEDPTLHPEDWQDWYSEQLLDAWMKIRNYADDNYFKINSSYNHFLEFVMNSENYYSNEDPEYHVVLLWNSIKDIQVISENVEVENFVAWVNINIEYN